MKNVKLFEQIRQEAIEFNALLIRQKADSERLETIFYKAWRADESNQQKHDQFHEQCAKTRQIEDRILNNKPFMGERWYMTEYLYSDAHAYEVLEVYSRDRMDVRRLKATETPEAREARMASFVPGGFVGHFDNSLQEWTFESDESNPIITVRRHKNGKFYRPGTRTCPFIMHDGPYEHYDFNF